MFYYVHNYEDEKNANLRFFSFAFATTIKAAENGLL